MNRQNLLDIYEDVYEDAHNGFLPSKEHMDNVRLLSDEQIQKELDWLEETIRTQAQEDKEYNDWLDELEKTQKEIEQEIKWIENYDSIYEKLEK